MSKRVLTLTLFFVFLAVRLYGQVRIPEDPSIADTAVIQTLIDSSYSLSYSHPDRAIRFGEKALTLSKEIGYDKGLAGAHGELGYAYSVKGEFSRSISHFREGLALNRMIGDSIELVSQLNDLGSTYKSKSAYDQALEHYFEALAICRDIGLQRGISATLGNIGLSYFEMEDHSQALKFYRKALKINKQLGNRSSLAVNYNNIGLLHGDEGQYREALNYHYKALEIRRELGYTLEIANSLNNIGRLYMQQKEYEKARHYLDSALIVNRGRDKELTSIIHENFAKTSYSSGEYDSALIHAQKTLDLSRDIGTKLGQKIGYELLSKIYRAMGDYKMAFLNQQKLMAVKDSILNEEKTRQINELQTKYESAQKEKEIAILEKEKQQEALLRNAFLAGLILIGIIGVLVYNRQRLKIKKSRTELENTRLKEQKLKQDLEFKNKQLTTHTLNLVQKNEAMQEIKDKISEIRHSDNGKINKSLQKLRNLVDYSFSLDDDWEQFRLYFEEVHEGFFETLKDQYPDLTPNELRLSALAKLNLSIKETATIMGITPDSVKTARYRLRKKLGMETGENLTEFLMEVAKDGKD